jgi:NAD(P)-dependent dehydrogenase (short-subunit alcohol dehydrogenase family)
MIASEKHTGAGRLAGKVAAITGAASGMGAESARVFAREGAKVVIADIDAERGEAVRREIEGAGGTASFIRTDVTQEKDIVSMIAAANARYGKLDILFNNAGGGVTGSGAGVTAIERLSADEWDRAHALNLRSVFLGVKHALASMRAAGGGSIISTGSDAGLRGIRGTDAYNALKAGVHMLTRSLAQSVAADNIRINAIAPGWIATPMLLANFPPGAEKTILPIAQPTRRSGLPRDIANAALFLASDEASFITGVVLPVDGGWLVQGDQNAALVMHLAGLERPEWS